MCIQSPDWYGVSYGYFITCCICAVFNMQKILPADIWSSGVWPLLTNLEDPELCRLAAALPATAGTIITFLGWPDKM